MFYNKVYFRKHMANNMHSLLNKIYVMISMDKKL